MRFDVITLFPELFEPHLNNGITRRAFANGSVQVKLWPLREHALDAYRRVDDRPYGGGPGMVMLAEPLRRALQAVAAARQEATSGTPSELARPEVIHFTPTGQRMTQELVQTLAGGPGAVLLCGRYEGVDQRIIDAHVTMELSLGDFVLSGGEIPALALLDAVARLQEGVLTAPSHEQDSFSNGLLEGPQYSRPEVLEWDGQVRAVPAVLLSGHHGHIERWQREQALATTARRRPDLIAQARQRQLLTPQDEAYLAALKL